MHSAFIFSEILILITAVTVSYIAAKLLRIPAIIGYLTVGVAIGPSGIGLLSNQDHILSISELGVMLLLFTIGLEVSPSRLWKLRREALLGGTLQVMLTISIVFILSTCVDLPLSIAVVLGFFTALSSTALVIKMLQEKNSLDSPHGRISLAILLMQDIFVVPLTLIIPLLNDTADSNGHFSLVLLISIGLLIILIYLAKKVIPYILDHVAALRSREGFFFTVTTLVLSAAGLTTWAGLSPALGSFLAGLLVSETEYKHTALTEIIPFRDLFLAVFFISIGMLLQVGTILHHPILIIILCIGIYSIKSIIVYIIVRLLDYYHTTALKTASGLGQVGEFSYVLLMIAAASDILQGDVLQVLISSSALTMVFTPIVFEGVAALDRFSQTKSINPIKDDPDRSIDVKKHVIIIGYGPSGKAIAQSLRELGFDYKILELNPVTVRTALKQNEPIILGDASHTDILRALDIERAVAVVLAINDYNAVKPIVSAIRRIAEDIYIIVRVRYIADAEDLVSYGIDEIIPSEIESSIQIASRLLHYLEIPSNVIDRHLAELRQDVYSSVVEADSRKLWRLPKNCEIKTITLENNDYAIGNTLTELQLRNITGANIIAIVRSGKILDNIAEDTLEIGDSLILSGNSLQVENGLSYLVEGK